MISALDMGHFFGEIFGKRNFEVPTDVKISVHGSLIATSQLRRIWDIFGLKTTAGKPPTQILAS